MSADTPDTSVGPGRSEAAFTSIDPVRRAAAIAVLLGGAVHLQQYWRVFHSQDIGPPFLANAVASLLVGIALLAWDGAVPTIIGVVLSGGSLLALLASRTTGLFGFDAVGYDVAEFEAIVAETSAVFLLIWSLTREPLNRALDRPSR